MEFKPGWKGFLYVLWDVIRHPVPKDPPDIAPVDWSAIGQPPRLGYDERTRVHGSLVGTKHASK